MDPTPEEQREFDQWTTQYNLRVMLECRHVYEQAKQTLLRMPPPPLRCTVLPRGFVIDDPDQGPVFVPDAGATN